MSLLERLKQKLEAAIRDARELNERAGADGLNDSERSDLIVQVGRAADDVDRLKGEVAIAERSAALEPLRAPRREITPDGPRPAGTGEGPDARGLPTVAQLEQRSRIKARLLRGDHVSDAEQVLAAEIFPAERLFQRVLASRARLVDLTPDEARAYDALMDLHERTYAMTSLANGMALVPEYFANEIQAGFKFEGRMADDMGMMVWRNPPIGQLNVPIVTDADSDAKGPSTKAAHAAGDDRAFTTGRLTITPEKKFLFMKVPREILLGAFVGFESWRNMNAGRQFGALLNRERTSNAANANIQGLATGALADNAEKLGTKTVAGWAVDTDAKAVAMEKNINDFLGRIDASHWMRVGQGMTVQMHFNTELYLGRIRANGQRVFELAPGTRKPILPVVGTAYDWNNRLDQPETTKSNSVVLLAANLGFYNVVYAGGMRTGTQFMVENDEVHLGWYLHTGAAFARTVRPLAAATFGNSA